MTFCFIIPAYEPDNTLIKTVRELTEKTDAMLFVVDDGSKNKSVFSDAIFSNTKVTLLKHVVNLGKGAALKTAFNYVLSLHPNIRGCVTLDADGQHSISDALAVFSKMEEKNALVLGVRNFSFKDKSIPLKSRVGNLLTRSIWRFATGEKITDTQTGLRGIPAQLMKECLHIVANRYEFEMEMLLKAQKNQIPIYELPIHTIYIDNNRGSHFNPLFDSLKIYFVIFRFSLSSLLSYVIDCAFFSIFILWFSFSVGYAFILARLISLFFNYNINKKIVFGLKASNNSALLKYMFLFLVNLYIGFVLMGYGELYGYNVFFVKITIESVLFFFNFFLQREWVFKREPEECE